MDNAKKTHKDVLVLQGGGALGAYHLGVFDQLEELGISPDWISGVSIGAVNAALIAGNPPERRMDALNNFWDQMSASFTPGLPSVTCTPLTDILSTAATTWAALFGVPGMYRTWGPLGLLERPGSAATISLYDPAPLEKTLEELVDFDLLNDGPIRVSFGAVNVTTGRMHFFDNKGGPDHVRLGAKHVLASGALPPGLPPIEIDGAYYWDGGIATNNPLQHVLDQKNGRDLNVFQVDLFSGYGPFPQNMVDSYQRAEEIRLAGRRHMISSNKLKLTNIRETIRDLLKNHGKDLACLPAHQLELLSKLADEPRVEIGRIVYRHKVYRGQLLATDFSRPTIKRHRARGREDTARILATRDWTQPPKEQGLNIIDPLVEIHVEEL